MENKNGRSSIKRSHRERRFLRWLGKRMLGVGRSIAGVASFGVAPPGFAEVMIAPEPSPITPGPAIDIEVGRNIRVRIQSTAPTGLASAVIKALAAR